MPPHMTDTPDFKDTVFLPKTDFPMKAGLPQKEPAILAKWQEAGLYQKLREARAGREKFILHDGPPYANGDMHIGHALNHILKDMVVRTQTLLGKDAPYVPGWDCHGLPIEWKVEEQYRKKKLNKDEVPVKEFRAECRAYAQSWVDVQREQLKRLGINADWDNPYLTMDFDAEATIVTELMKFAESGQLYRGAKPVMWSPVEKTALAEAEVEYEDITSTQIDVAFEIVECPNQPGLMGAYAVIWTTTPWTIPVNQALAYGPDVEYVALNVSIEFTALGDIAPSVSEAIRADASLSMIDQGTFIVAKELVSAFSQRVLAQVRRSLPEAPNVEVSFSEVHAFKGSQLEGAIARHPMYDLTEVNVGPAGFFRRPRPFLPGDFVTTDSGTGLVHMSPDHGEDDFDLCKANGIDPVFAVEADGKYRADWLWLGGEGSVINPKFNAPDGPICNALREAGGLLAASADYKHSYPHSWRSKAKVIYRCTPQWFVPMDRAMPSPLQGRGGSSLAAEGEGTERANASVDVTHDSPSPSPVEPLGSVRGTDPSTPEGEGDFTLRQIAMTAIAATRWVPEKGRNRINSMVEGRPDWVLSRQRAWGVPITLFVDRKTGAYLCDPTVNARIIAAVREVGVDAWCDERAQEYLGSEYKLADYERVVDILDVWFDSGCTHAFVLESGKWPDLTRPADHIGPWADLYLEGTDQHRGWFQSSLLESCGTRGHAPYKAVLTHGFTMDQKGMKMSKSLGNTINPLDLMRDSGADILRLWALTVDFTEDHRIGKEILQGVSDQYRKLRNTFRYMLGALDGFSEAERVAVEDMPELERYVLHLLADMDAKLRQAVDDFDFNTYVKLLTEFANNDLSAFFFDIRKDCLYCDVGANAPLGSPKRMAYRTVLDILFHALVRYAAPVLVFTSEEVWQTRFGADAESVHFSDWPELPIRRSSEGWSPSRLATEDGVRRIDEIGPSLRWGDELVEKWAKLRALRAEITEAIEPMRREKLVGSSLAVQIVIEHDLVPDDTDEPNFDHQFEEVADLLMTDLLVTDLSLFNLEPNSANNPYIRQKTPGGQIWLRPTTNHKCGRCWRHLPEVVEDGALCNRCDTVLNG
jgi:isoleucyl-tRNA synthetase